MSSNDRDPCAVPNERPQRTPAGRMTAFTAAAAVIAAMGLTAAESAFGSADAAALAAVEAADHAFCTTITAFESLQENQ